MTEIILIADDDESDVQFLRQALAETGADLDIRDVRDGREAVDYLAGIGPYADRKRYPFPTRLFLDLKMPRFSGLEVLKWIRDHRDIGRLPVTVLSGSLLPGDRGRVIELGADFVVKPVTYRELAEFVQEFCRKTGISAPSTKR